MSLSIVHTRAALGVNAPPITVEVHISKGLPGLTMVGLPETTVKEARDRVRSAIINSGYEYPAKEKNHHQPCSSRSAKRRGTI